MSKSQRDKGYRTENNLRKFFTDAGIKCKRVPLSGGAPGSPGDLLIGEDEQKCEVKARGDGFKRLYDWLEDNRYLFIKADRKDYLAVMRLDDFIRLFLDKKRSSLYTKKRNGELI